MANGDTVKEIKQLLSEKGKINTPTALRLSLDLQMQIFDRQDKYDAEIQMLKKELDRVEKSSIGAWMLRNPKLAVFMFTVYLIISALVDFKMVLAKALGVEL